MHVLFVLEGFWEWIGLRCLSASLKEAGYNCDLIIDNNIQNIAQYVKKHSPELVGYLTITGQHKFCVVSASLIKKVSPQTKVIFGGPHASFFPEIINEDSVDYVCQGEGDLSLVELVRRMENNETTINIPGIWAKQEGKVYKNPPQKLIEDLDSLPLRDNDLFEKYKIFRNSKALNIMSGRGCPYNCSFCFNKSFKELYENKNKYTRFRSAERVIEEILEAKSKYSFKYVRFQDDTFVINKKWLMDFIEKYAGKVGLPYYCCSRINCLDEEVVKALKESGCHLTGFGLESGVEEIRNGILNKNLSDEKIIRATDLLHKYKLPFLTTSMLALPNETFEDGIQSIIFNQKIKTSFPWYSVFQPYPGTEIADYIQSSNILEAVDYNGIGSDYHSKTVFQTEDAKKLAKLHKFAIIATKFPWTLPLVKLLVRLPDNFIFKIIHRLSHTWIYSQCNKNGFFNTIFIGIHYEFSNLISSNPGEKVEK